MERTKNIREHQGDVGAILTSDWHLREDSPSCRIDDFWNAQWRKVQWVSNLQRKYKCAVFHGGDLFHHWKPSPMLLSECMVHFPDRFYTVYGQHDLPQHNLELAYKSGIFTLEKAGIVSVLDECSWGQTPTNGSLYEGTVLIWHKFNYQGPLPWPGCSAPRSSGLLRQHPQFRLILTGDNHTPFVESFEGRVLVNPGSLTRQDADQVNYRPRVYLWYPESNTVELVYIPIEAGVVSRAHIEHQKEREERIDAFISKLNTDDLVTVNFEENLRRFAQINQVRESVMQLIYEAIQ